MKSFVRSSILVSLGILLMVNVAYAHHLGPVVIGVERMEPVYFCMSAEHLNQFIAAETASVKSGGSVEDFLKLVTPLISADQCQQSMIRYTPKKVLREWQGREVTQEGIVRIIPMAAVEATIIQTDVSGKVTPAIIYIYSPDPPIKVSPQ